MTYFEFRQWVEGGVPWWLPFVAPAVWTVLYFLFLQLLKE